MTHVGLVASDSWYIWNFRAGTIQGLLIKGYKVTIFCGNLEYVDKLRSLGVNVVYVPFVGRSINPIINLRDLFRFFVAVKKHRPLVILSFNPKTNIYTGLIRRIIKFGWIANISGTGVLGEKNGILGNLIKQILKFVFKKVDHAIFQNCEDRDNWISQNIVRKSGTLRQFGSGINLEKFKKIKPPGGEITVVCIARLLKKKGIGNFIELAAQTKKIEPNIKFCLAGPIIKEKNLGFPLKKIQIAQSEGYIQYVGMLDDVRPLISQRTIGCLLTKYKEGLPKSMIEFLAFGRPILISSFSGAKDLVPKDTNGLILDLCDNQWIENAIKFLLDLSKNPTRYDQACDVSYSIAKENFNEEVGIGEYISLIEAYANVDR